VAGVLVHEAHQRGQRAGAHLGVGVEQEQELAAGPRGAEVVADGVAVVARVADQLRLGEVARDHVCAGVGAGVVHHDELVRHLGAGGAQAGEAGGQQGAGVPGEDDDREPRGRRGRRANRHRVIGHLNV